MGKKEHLSEKLHPQRVEKRQLAESVEQVEEKIRKRAHDL
jgi:hypothetical protein